MQLIDFWSLEVIEIKLEITSQLEIKSISKSRSYMISPSLGPQQQCVPLLYVRYMLYIPGVHVKCVSL